MSCFLFRQNVLPSSIAPLLRSIIIIKDNQLLLQLPVGCAWFGQERNDEKAARRAACMRVIYFGYFLIQTVNDFVRIPARVFKINSVISRANRKKLRTAFHGSPGLFDKLCDSIDFIPIFRPNPIKLAFGL